MAVHHNQPILKNHFRKSWQKRVKTHFDQPGKKVSRRTRRVAKAAQVAPRPLDTLRPVVRCPTIKYNRKVRAGRGFTFAELKEVGLTPKYARTVGIAVDHRRQNRSEEGFQANVKRLQEYKSKLVVFDKNSKVNEAAQYSQADVSKAFPVVQDAPETGTRAVEVPEQSAFRTLRVARSDKRLQGVREKRSKERAEKEAEKNKK